jgi:hypothetical protein
VPKPTELSVNKQECPWTYSGQQQDQVTSAAEQSYKSELQYDGRSFKMRGFEQVRKSLKVAGLMLMLLLVAGMGSNLLAQSAPTLEPWPAPATIPPAPAILPVFQTVPAAFDMTGMMQYASLDPTPGICSLQNPALPPSPTNPPLPAQCKTTGGWVEIGNVVIKVPSSTVVVFPNTLMTWEEAFENNPYGVTTETGLAMADTKRLPGNYIVHVQGNIVSGQYIAGLVFINQVIADAGIQGFIEKFDYANSIMYVDGQRVQINDPLINNGVGVQPMNPDGTPLIDPTTGVAFPPIPKGRYSAGQAPCPLPATAPPGATCTDVRFAVDQDNPSVTAQSGYPMCIPMKSPYLDGSDGSKGAATSLLLPDALQDLQCPEKNRMRDNAGLVLVQIFVMNAPGVPQDSGLIQDPYLEAPFEVGDFVSVVGSMEMDATGSFISATTILNTSVGILTAPGIDPVYTQVSVLVQGTGGVPDPAFPQEAGVRTRVEGFSTDPTRTIDVSAIDQDCNGNLIFREPAWTSNFPVEPGPPGIGVIGRWRARFPQGGNFLPAVQNVGARVSGSFIGKQKNGLTYGEYQLPEATFIFPENITPGTPPPAGNFRDLAYLVNGLGPLPMVPDVFDSFQVQLGQQPSQFYGNQQLGQLAPFPDATIPAATCIAGNFVSVARPVYSSTPNPAYAGITVTLDGTGSTPPTGPFTWTQIINPGDPVVTINNPTTAKPTFTAPLVATSQNLSFQLIVGDGALVPASNPASVLVPVIPPPAGAPPVVSIASDIPSPVPSGSAVTLTANGVDPAAGALTFTWTAPAGVVLIPGAANGSIQTFVAPTLGVGVAPVPLTFTATVTSSVTGLTGTATITIVDNPSGDFILINQTGVVYRTRKARLVVTATDTTPGIIMTCTLDIINPATGLQYTGVMGPTVPAAPGVYTITFSNVPPPNTVTVTSNAGGVAVSGITFLR